MNTAAGRLIFKIEPPNHIDARDLEDILATDELFLNYFNEFLSLPTFPEALFFNKNTGWFEVVDGAKERLSAKLKAAVRASKRKSKIYKAVDQHSFTNLPLIPLQDEVDGGVEEIDTTFTVTTLNKEQGLRWIKDNRFTPFLQSELYIEYRLAKILSQTNDRNVERKSTVNIQLDYTPHPAKIRPEDIVEEESEDDSETLLKRMCVCMGEATPTDTDAFLSKARLLEGTTVTPSSLGSRPISSLIRPDSGIGSLTQLATESASSDDDSSRLLVKPSKHGKSVTPRPNDKVCHTTDESADEPSWKKSAGSGVYICPSTDNGDDGHQATYLEELERLAAESVQSRSSSSSSPPPQSIEFESVDEMSSVIAGTVIKYMLAEFNKSQPEVYAHHKAVRDLISDESMRNYSLTDIDNACCDWVIESIQPTPVEASVDETKAPRETTRQVAKETVDKKMQESDEDSVLCSDDDYDSDRDEHFRSSTSRKFYPLNCKRGIDDFKQFLKGTAGEKHWNLWIDIDRARTLTPSLINSTEYMDYIRNRYHRTGAIYELTLGTKQSLNLVDSSNWSLSELYSLQNKIAEPLLVYWAPQYIVKNQVQAEPGKHSVDYRHQKSVRVSSARRQINTHPDPKTNSLFPLRPKCCKPTIRTEETEKTALYSGPTPKDFMWRPQEAVTLPEMSRPIGHRRTHTVQSVELCMTHAAGNKQRMDHEAGVSKSLLPRPTSRQEARPHSANATSLSQPRRVAVQRPATAIGAARTEKRMSKESDQTEHTSATVLTGSESGTSTHPHTSANDQLMETESRNSVQSDFIGGRRMNALLKALSRENESGLFFRKYVERVGNQVWLCCIRFWENVQSYHHLFYAKSLDKYQVRKRAKEIFSRYISATSAQFIGCPLADVRSMHAQLSPPYEELFDKAEVYALERLLQAWEGMNSKERQLFQEVQTKNIVVNLETKSKLVINLQRKGFLRPGDLEPDEDPMENFEDPVYDETIFEQIPEDFRDFTLEKILRTPIHLENFRQFLQSHFATMDLSCWMDIELLRKMDPKMTEQADEKAKDIKQKYFNKKYFFGPNSPASRQGLDTMMKSIGGWGKIFPDRPDDELIIGAQSFVRDRLSLKWLPMFLASEQFAELIRPSQQMVDVAEALLLSRQRRNQRLKKMLESRWVSSSKEIIAFRQSLLNPVVSYQFQRFVSVKSDLLENDVLFWRECQKYKHLHHQHTEDSFLSQKINVIINCFVASSMEPSLQIDIPQEQADRITEKKRELGPYMFREAQLTVFRVLFDHWADFCEFKSNTAVEQILPTIERKRRRAKLKERQRQKELEEQQERENARRRALGLPVEGEESLDVGEGPNAGGGKRKEGEDDASDIGEGQRVAWSYSNYITALEKEDVINRTNEDTFSCVSTESGGGKPVKPVKPVIDVSDLKDLKAPTSVKPAVDETDQNPAPVKKKSLATSKGNRNTKGAPEANTSHTSATEKKKLPRRVSMQLDEVKQPLTNKAPVKTAHALSRAMPPLVKKQ